MAALLNVVICALLGGEANELYEFELYVTPASPIVRTIGDVSVKVYRWQKAYRRRESPPPSI